MAIAITNAMAICPALIFPSFAAMTMAAIHNVILADSAEYRQALSGG
jgi:hypothetical protein